jgi:hypothetical protein
MYPSISSKSYIHHYTLRLGAPSRVLKIYITPNKLIQWSDSGSGSYFGKVLVPILVQAPVPVPIPGRLAVSMLEAALFPRKLASNF